MLSNFPPFSGLPPEAATTISFQAPALAEIASLDARLARGASRIEGIVAAGEPPAAVARMGVAVLQTATAWAARTVASAPGWEPKACQLRWLRELPTEITRLVGEANMLTRSESEAVAGGVLRDAGGTVYAHLKATFGPAVG